MGFRFKLLISNKKIKQLFEGAVESADQCDGTMIEIIPAFSMVGGECQIFLKLESETNCSYYFQTNNEANAGTS